MVIIVSIYMAAIVAANLLVAAFGPWVSPINSFVLIGLDLALRDVMHDRLSRRAMISVIVAAGVVSYLLNPTAGRIAAASAASFVISAVADLAVFSVARGTWSSRAHKSNLAGAAVDSVVFPLAAFGSAGVAVIAAQFAAKTLGAAVWTAALSRYFVRAGGES